MSEGESTPHRRPPTIDLTATEIETEGAASRPAGTAPPAEDGGSQPAKNAGGLRSHVLGGVIGAVVVGALAVILWVSGVVPARNAAPVLVNNAAADVAVRLDKIQGELQSRPSDAALISRVAAVEAQTKVLSDSLAAINRRLDDLAVSAQSARQSAEAADKAASGAVQTANAAAKAAGDAATAANAAKSSTQSAAQNSVKPGDLAALANRLAALESAIKALSKSTEQQAASANDRAARAAIAAAALGAAIERGTPYQAELDSVKSLGADPNALAALQPLAVSGVPTTAELAHQLSRLLPSVQHAIGTASTGGSLLGRLEDNAKTLVRITPVDAPKGDAPAAVVDRLGADAARGDIAAALADTARLPQSAKSLVEPWVAKVNARAAAIAASRSISAKALADLGNPTQ